MGIISTFGWEQSGYVILVLCTWDWSLQCSWANDIGYNFEGSVLK